MSLSLFNNIKRRSSMFGLMHLLDMYRLLLIYSDKIISNGGETLKKFNCINSWVKIMFLSTPSFSHQVWLQQIKIGLFFIISQQPSTWIMNLANFQKETAQEYLETLLLKQEYQLKFGDIIYLLTDQRNLIHNFLGTISG